MLLMQLQAIHQCDTADKSSGFFTIWSLTLVTYFHAEINSFSILFYSMPYLLWSSDTDVPHACLLFEGLYSGFTIITLRCHGGHVRPVEEPEDLGHGFGLVEVRGHRACEVIITGLVAELGTGRRIAYLRNLKKPEKIGNLKGESKMRHKSINSKLLQN